MYDKRTFLKRDAWVKTVCSYSFTQASLFKEGRSTYVTALTNSKLQIWVSQFDRNIPYSLFVLCHSGEFQEKLSTEHTLPHNSVLQFSVSSACNATDSNHLFDCGHHFWTIRSCPSPSWLQSGTEILFHLQGRYILQGLLGFGRSES